MLTTMRYRFKVMILSFVLVLAPRLASAELFIDYFLGTSDTQGNDITAFRQTSSLFGTQTPSSATRHVEFDSSTTFGIRGGYWLEDYRIGIAMELSHFQVDGPNVDIGITPFSFLGFYRWSFFENDVFPNGRLRPYLGLGLAIFTADVSIDFRPEVNGVVSGVTGKKISPDLRAGISWSFSEHYSLYGEVRYLKVNLNLNETRLTSIFSKEIVQANLSIKTNQSIVGLTYHF